MNLIEQLGGYEAAKARLKSANNEGHLLISVPTAAGCADVYDHVLEKALLAYRREHSIFEVGDFVLPVSDEFSNEVCELTEDYIGQDFKYRTKRGGFGYIVKSFMTTAWRHATDEEIANNARSK